MSQQPWLWPLPWIEDSGVIALAQSGLVRHPGQRNSRWEAPPSMEDAKPFNEDT
jgi:hypothetical protein